MRLKFIYWFSFYNLDSPTVRYRGQYSMEFFKSNYGINSFFIFPGYQPSIFFKFIRAYFSALFFRKKDSLIVFQSINSNFIYANALKFLLKIRKKNTVYDLDDADYLRFPPKTIFYFIKNCAMVTVGSTELLKNISKINKNTVLITCPTPDLKIVKQSKNNLLTVGWIGDLSTGHKESLLTSFFPALHNLPFKVKLILLGVAKKTDYAFLTDYFRLVKNILLEIPQDVDWKNETEVQQRIVGFDIGIATLLDNEFFRSKSAFKTKQCFNNGVPVLSSDIPENNLFVEHGKNGFLCSTPSDFRQRIIEINEMSKERFNLLSAGARNTIQKFNLTKYCEDFIQLYEGTNTAQE